MVKLKKSLDRLYNIDMSILNAVFGIITDVALSKRCAIYDIFCN